MKWISSRRETIPLTEKELVIIKEKETSGSERRWGTGEVVAASPNSMLSLPLSVTRLLVLKSYMREWRIWSHGQVAMRMRNGVCVCFDEQKIVFWGSFIGNYYTLICQPSSTAVHLFLLLSLCPLSPWLFCYITEENQGVELLKRRLWAWWSWGISCYFWNYCWVLDKDGFNHNFNADFKVGPNLRTRF